MTPHEKRLLLGGGVIKVGGKKEREKEEFGGRGADSGISWGDFVFSLYKTPFSGGALGEFNP